MSKQPSPELSVVTANRLADGAVVFLTAELGWTTDLQAARLLHDNAELESQLVAVRGTDSGVKVVGPYAIEVGIVDGIYRPVSLRERIRVDGLTFRAIASEAVAYI